MEKELLKLLIVRKNSFHRKNNELIKDLSYKYKDSADEPWAQKMLNDFKNDKSEILQ